MQEWSKKIDQIIEEEKSIKADLPNHPRFTSARQELDRKIQGLRTLKKEVMTYWREINRDPEITL